MMNHPDLNRGNIGRMALGLLSLSLLLSVSACDAPKPGAAALATSGPPKIEVVGGEKVEWGEVGPGVLKRTVLVTNTGGDTLQLADVKASCGCTTAPLDKKVLLPGDTARIDVSMDVATRVGEQHKSITITSNDSARSAVVVSLHATVVRDVVATPDYFPPISNAQKGREDSTTVELRNTGEVPITVQPPTMPDAAEMLIRFNMSQPITLKPGEARNVVAYVKPIKDGTSTGNVVFQMDGKRQKEIKLNITSTVMPKEDGQG